MNIYNNRASDLDKDTALELLVAWQMEVLGFIPRHEE